MRRAVLLAVSAAGALLVIDPARFTIIGSEDGPVEGLTAVAFLAAAIVLAAGIWRHGRDWSRQRKVLAVLGVVLLVMITGEEISRGQRILGFGIPDALRGINSQEEFNLHNIRTNTTELLVYTSAALSLIVLPWLPYRTRWFARWPLVASFTPPLAALPAAACLLLGASQATVLAFGGRSARLWDATEYKELFIGIGVLVAAWCLLRRWASSDSPVSGATTPGLERLEPADSTHADAPVRVA